MTLLEAGVGASGDTSNEAEAEMEGFKRQILSKLYVIRDRLATEGGDPEELKKERDAVKQENAILRAEIERLNYRVRHLIKELNTAEAGKQ